MAKRAESEKGRQTGGGLPTPDVLPLSPSVALSRLLSAAIYFLYEARHQRFGFCLAQIQIHQLVARNAYFIGEFLKITVHITVNAQAGGQRQ